MCLSLKLQRYEHYHWPRTFASRLSGNPPVSVNGHVDEAADNEITPADMPDLVDDGVDFQLSVLFERRGKMYDRLMKKISIVAMLLETNNVDTVNAEVINVDWQL